MAVLFFSGALADHIETINISPNEKHAIIAQAADLGNAKVPTDVSAENKALIEKFYHESFIVAYSNILKISAGLGFLGALMAFFFIRDTVVNKENITGKSRLK